MNRIAALPNYRVAAGGALLLPLSLMLVLCDQVSLLAAFGASTAVTGLIQMRLFDRAPAEVLEPFLTQRVTVVAFLSCPLTAWFAYKKHYTGRRGHWTEVKHILLGVLAIALVDGWVHFALKMQASRLWQGQLWLYAAGFIIVGRFLARRALTSLGLWQRPTLLIGTARAFAELQSSPAASAISGTTFAAPSTPASATTWSRSSSTSWHRSATSPTP